MTLDPKSCIMLPSETTAIVLETLTVIWAAVCVVAVKLIIAKIKLFFHTDIVPPRTTLRFTLDVPFIFSRFAKKMVEFWSFKKFNISVVVAVVDASVVVVVGASVIVVVDASVVGASVVVQMLALKRMLSVKIPPRIRVSCILGAGMSTNVFSTPLKEVTCLLTCENKDIVQPTSMPLFISSKAKLTSTKDPVK
jgi:hypothetical protein